jgi:hypothetical protein
MYDASKFLFGYSNKKNRAAIVPMSNPAQVPLSQKSFG